MSISVEDILRGTGIGSMQTVGQMQVIPILNEEDDDETFAPPEFNINTSNYGTVNLRNDADRPTIAPPGAGWVVKEAAQDHAIGGGSLLKAGEHKTIETARCIQQTQGGYIREDKHPMLILPLALRSKALADRKSRGYDRLWSAIGEFNSSMGCTSGYGGGHLEYFLKQFQKQLDEFVAEFELVPRQVGAIVLVGGQVVGVERAPSQAFWQKLWEPLVRVCYGSVALKFASNKTPPATRVALNIRSRSIAGLRQALEDANKQEETIASDVSKAIRNLQLKSSGSAEASLPGNISLTTVANKSLSGQIVSVKDRITYASLCAATA